MGLAYQRWVLRHRPHGEIKPGDLEFVSEPVRDLAEGEPEFVPAEDDVIPF